MALPIAFIYVPTTDLAASLSWYRDTLGHDEMWREGDTTVGLAVPGTDIALMVDQIPEGEGGPGPIFMADDVEAFLNDHPDIKPVADPTPIPDGTLAAFQDPSGNWFYVLDQKDAS